MKRIFISSVQHELAEVRKLLKRYITRNPPLNEPLNIEGSSELTEEIFKLICKKPGIKQKEIQSEVGRSIATVKRQLDLLIGYVEHRGSKKTGGYYRVINS